MVKGMRKNGITSSYRLHCQITAVDDLIAFNTP